MTVIADNREAWQVALSAAVTSVAELCDCLGLTVEQCGVGESDFPLRVPRSFIKKMVVGDPRDPLLLQVLPQDIETKSVSGFIADPLQESKHSPLPGLLHKYAHRVLLIVTGGCAVHCRYCFRRHFPYQEHTRSAQVWGKTLDYLRAHSDVEEVIFSGGDPLILKDAILSQYINELAEIPHIKRLRIHSRVPVVLPERMTDKLWATLTATRLPVVLVLHTNHAAEIDATVARGLVQARKNGIHLLNQAVLLRGVNDSQSALRELSERLFAAGVMPYYLHVLDAVAGAQHFHVADARAQVIYRELLASLPGYLVPKLVREIPGKPAKTPLPFSW